MYAVALNDSEIIGFSSSNGWKQRSQEVNYYNSRNFKIKYLNKAETDSGDHNKKNK